MSAFPKEGGGVPSFLFLLFFWKFVRGWVVMMRIASEVDAWSKPLVSEGFKGYT